MRASTRSIIRCQVELRGHFRAFGDRLIGHHGFCSVDDIGADRIGEGADRGVILAHRLVIVADGNRNAVLGSLKLALQRKEALIRLDLRIRSEKRSVGKGCVSTCRTRWAASHTKKKK